MEEKVTVTDKEHTYLVLKWGVNYLLDLYFLWAGGASGLTELERRAAKLGEKLRNEADQIMVENIRIEIDREMIEIITNSAKDQSK